MEEKKSIIHMEFGREQIKTISMNVRMEHLDRAIKHLLTMKFNAWREETQADASSVRLFLLKFMAEMTEAAQDLKDLGNGDAKGKKEDKQ